MGILIWGQNQFDKVRGALDFVGPLLLRLYLVPVFFVAGSNKWNPLAENGTLNPVEGLKDVADWFGNPDGGLGLPAPLLMAILAWAAEYIGAICLAFGVAVRWVCVPLMFTMIVAMSTVHWDHGWQSVHDLKSPYASENADGAIERLSAAKNLIKEHGNYKWLTEKGNVIVSNNGIEWAATYFIMLVALLFLGGGRYFSIDYWIRRKYGPKDI
jgi:putative oxidoreductase